MAGGHDASGKAAGVYLRIAEGEARPTRPRWHQDLMLREMTRPSEACREIVEDFIRPMAQTLGGILQTYARGRPGIGRCG